MAQKLDKVGKIVVRCGMTDFEPDSGPKTSEQVREKVAQLAQLLSDTGGKMHVESVIKEVAKSLTPPEAKRFTELAVIEAVEFYAKQDS